MRLVRPTDLDAGQSSTSNLRRVAVPIGRASGRRAACADQEGTRIYAANWWVEGLGRRLSCEDDR
eukprot:SAG31_NODE_5178_length_2697_cov_3.029638_3_plen_65_part_00